MDKKALAKLVALLVAVVLVLLLIFQNTAAAPVRFLFFRTELPQSLMLLITFLLGYAAGIVSILHLSARRKR